MKMIYILIFCITILTQAQEYTIYYQGKLPKVRETQINAKTKNSEKYINQYLPEIDQEQTTLYQLAIKKDKSIFSVQKGSYNDTITKIITKTEGTPDTLQYIFIREDKIIYKDRINKLQYSYVKFKSGLNRMEEFLLERPLGDFNWKINTKTKEILGYLCKMAVSGEGEEMVIAWYTEEIPVSEGPSKYWGLPGLILEVNNKNKPLQAVYITKSILVNSVSPPEHLEKTKKEGFGLYDKSLLYEN